MHAERRRVRRTRFIAVVVTFLIACVAVGCGGSGGPGNIDGRDGERDAAATNEENTASGADRSAAKTTEEPVGLDVKVVSPAGKEAYLTAGFGEGSLWVTARDNCEACGSGPDTVLKRLDPRSGEEVAAIPLKGFYAETTEVAFGAGSMWVSSGDFYPGSVSRRSPGDVVLRIDTHTNQVVDRVAVDRPSGLDFGHGSVWVTSAGYGTVSRIDPETGKVTAVIEVGRGVVDIATDENSGDVWVAGLYNPKKYPGGGSPPEYSEERKLSRVDPETNHVVAEIPIEAGSRKGGAQSVSVGEGAVWTQSVDGKLYKVDPATNEIVARVFLGGWSSHLAVYGGAVWATVQVSSGTRLVRVDPRTEQVVATADLGPPEKGSYGPLVAGGGRVWFVSAAGNTGKGELAWVAP